MLINLIIFAAGMFAWHKRKDIGVWALNSAKDIAGHKCSAQPNFDLDNLEPIRTKKRCSDCLGTKIRLNGNTKIECTNCDDNGDILYTESCCLNSYNVHNTLAVTKLYYAWWLKKPVCAEHARQILNKWQYKYIVVPAPKVAMFLSLGILIVIPFGILSLLAIVLPIIYLGIVHGVASDNVFIA